MEPGLSRRALPLRYFGRASGGTGLHTRRRGTSQAIAACLRMVPCLSRSLCGLVARKIAFVPEDLSSAGPNPMRILLIEDDNMIGKAVRQGLILAGFAVDWVTDGRAAELA